MITANPSSIDRYQQALQDAFDKINSAIVPGVLQGNGLDKTAQRNGLIIAANILQEMISERVK